MWESQNVCKHYKKCHIFMTWKNPGQSYLKLIKPGVSGKTAMNGIPTHDKQLPVPGQRTPDLTNTKQMCQTLDRDVPYKVVELRR